jgi:sentrin-specific protease 1
MQSPIDKHLLQKESLQPIEIDAGTMKAMEVEVLDLAFSDTKSISVMAMANALAGSRKVMDAHGNLGMKQHPLKSITKSLGLLSFRRSKSDDDSVKRRYELVNAFNWLEKQPNSTSSTFSTWEEAKQLLSSIIKFPLEQEDDEEITLLIKAQEEEADKIEQKHTQRLEDVFRKDVGALLPSTDKWRQIASLNIPSSKVGGDKKEEASYRSSIEKADTMFILRTKEVEKALEEKRKKKEVQELEERFLEKERQKEAKKRASSLMRQLTKEEASLVRASMYGGGASTEILAESATDTVQRQSIRTLQPGQWLNDEVIHYFYLMLAKRDEDMSKHDPSRKRSHFFKSFFITKLLNEGHSDPAMEGTYEYRNVKRWSKKVPGKDIFKLDKIFFPINQGQMHWLCGVVFIQKKQIKIYDSMGSGGRHYLESLLQYLQDEHMDKKKCALPDIDEWELVGNTRDIPQQRNGTWFFFALCGVYRDTH